ncbi:6094_t:CDS:1 [Funneliformis mosseae]|uniref:6094_t:CDS:1 n=1 Tax=Funneliformis mosseae TaxID=27381 RepID=A0A9N8VWL0_FUNMO|nr:6094_t:CDS:1 [Funneliformis mosseae]
MSYKNKDKKVLDRRSMHNLNLDGIKKVKQNTASLKDQNKGNIQIAIKRHCTSQQNSSNQEIVSRNTTTISNRLICSDISEDDFRSNRPNTQSNTLEFKKILAKILSLYS